MKMPELKELPTQEDINRLERENAELKAQVEQLREANEAQKFCEFDLLDAAFAKTPAQCLAEVKAQAVEDFYCWIITVRPNCGLVGMGDLKQTYIPKYANQLCQQAKK